jgi:hypothetical protein
MSPSIFLQNEEDNWRRCLIKHLLFARTPGWGINRRGMAGRDLAFVFSNIDHEEKGWYCSYMKQGEVFKVSSSVNNLSLLFHTYP